MRCLPYGAALLLAACSSANPLFGLDPTESSSTSAGPGTTSEPPPTTSVASDTVDPGAPGSTTNDSSDPGSTTTPLTSMGPGTESPSEPATSGTTDPNSTTGNLDTTTGNLDTTGEQCELTLAPDFSDVITVNGMELMKCVNPKTTLTGRLKQGNAELMFDTTDPKCGSKVGILKLGSGYEIPANSSDCATLTVFRGGDGPLCDIDFLFINANQGGQPLATGVFSPPFKFPMNPPPPLVIPEDLTRIECCPVEAAGCCEVGPLGDYSLVFPMTDAAIPPASSDPDVPVLGGGIATVLNIQNYLTVETCNLTGRHDWVASRTE